MRHKSKKGLLGWPRHVTSRSRSLVIRRIKRIRIDDFVTYDRTRNRTQAHIFPKYPVEKADQKLAESILNNFEKLPELQKKEVMLVVDYFLEIFSIHKGTLTFTGRPRMAADFISALALLGIPKTSLQLVELSGVAKGAAAAERRVKWEKLLGMEGCEWRFSDRGYGGKRKPGVIGIRVFPKVREGMVREGSYGFRYAMYILAIGYWS